MNRQLASELATRLSERDRAILDSLERFRLLDTRQIQRLHFVDHPGDVAAARACTRALCRLQDDLHVVRALRRRIGGVRRGSASYIWQLASTGERYLRTLRGDARRRRFTEPGATFVRHTLAVNEVAVSLIATGRSQDRFTVQRLETEPANWRRHLGPYGELKWLKPDLHVVTTIEDHDGDYEEYYFIEVDLGTEHLPRIQTKCRNYAAYAATGAYQAAEGLFPQVVWLSDDSGRQAALRRAIADAADLPQELFRVEDPAAFVQAAAGLA